MSILSSFDILQGSQLYPFSLLFVAMLSFMAFALVPLGNIDTIIRALYGCQKPLDGTGAHPCIDCYGTVRLATLTAAQKFLSRMSGILCWPSRTIVLLNNLEVGWQQEERRFPI